MRTAMIHSILLFSVMLATRAHCQEIVRHPWGSTFPIARAVAVPQEFELIFHSGVGPQPLDVKAPKDSAAYWGDTRAQTLSSLRLLEGSLKDMGLTLGDVVKLTVYLVADPATGRMDLDGYMDAYKKFFGTKEQPNLPARATLQVAGLYAPGMLIEVEAVLARKKQP